MSQLDEQEKPDVILPTEAGELDGSPASSYYSACLLAFSLDALPIDRR